MSSGDPSMGLAAGYLDGGQQEQGRDPLLPGGWCLMAGGAWWWLVAAGLWPVVMAAGGSRLRAGGWWLMVAGGCWLVAGPSQPGNGPAGERASQRARERRRQNHPRLMRCVHPLSLGSVL